MLTFCCWRTVCYLYSRCISDYCLSLFTDCKLHCEIVWLTVQKNWQFNNMRLQASKMLETLTCHRSQTICKGPLCMLIVENGGPFLKPRNFCKISEMWPSDKWPKLREVKFECTEWPETICLLEWDWVWEDLHFLWKFVQYQRGFGFLTRPHSIGHWVHGPDPVPHQYWLIDVAPNQTLWQ